MTKGKMALELLEYAKSAIKNFDQSEASIVVMWLPKVASDWSKFFIAELAYLSNSKTILPLVIFWSGHYLNIFFSENSLLGPNPPIFFMTAPTFCPQWTILKRKFSTILEFRSYMVKFFNFEIPLSHWLKLLGWCSIWFLQRVWPELFEMVWHLMIGQKLGVPGHF